MKEEVTVETKIPGAYGASPSSDTAQQPKQPGQNQTAQGPRAKGLKHQEGSLGGGDSTVADR